MCAYAACLRSLVATPPPPRRYQRLDPAPPPASPRYRSFWHPVAFTALVSYSMLVPLAYVSRGASRVATAAPQTVHDMAMLEEGAKAGGATPAAAKAEAAAGGGGGAPGNGSHFG